MRKLLISTLLLAMGTATATSQHFDMTQWGENRGYTQAPYWRYEADAGYCESSGRFLAQTDDQQYIQSEASNQQAVELTNGQSVTWRNDTGAANAVTMRYSVPWGTQATVGVFANGQQIGTMTLDTTHSWQWNNKHPGNRHYKPEFYSVHFYSPDRFARMRFIDAHCLLDRDITQGSKFEIRNLSSTPVTVDFVEIEKADRVEPQADWAVWDGSNLQEFINRNQGRTVYIPEGTVRVGATLNLGSAHLRGAGIWFTHLTFPRAAFNPFGTSVRDMHITCEINQRYPNSGEGEGGSGYDAKCFNGACNGATVERVLVEYFECGGWLSGCHGMTIRHSRFRNNYADGLNFADGASNNTVEQCSFRNNGDDDMASWSNSGNSQNNRYANCTAEHNWRASSIGFFGGGNHIGENLLIKDGLENGVRLVSDFPGQGFHSRMTFRNIAIVHQACIDGEPGRHGDFWGVNEAALHVEASANYPIETPVFENIDIIDSRGNAVFIGSGQHAINNMQMNGIRVDGIRHSGSYAFYFENPKGSASLAGIEICNVASENYTNFVNADLTGGTMGEFTLSCDGVSAPPADIPTGVSLHLTAMAWEKTPAARVNAAITEGDQVMFSLKIENKSDVALPADCHVPARVVMADGSTLTMPKITDGIAANDSKIISATWNATAGAQTATAEIDPMKTLGDAVSHQHRSISKRFNVMEGNPFDLPFVAVDGVDLQVLDILWKKAGEPDSEIGRGPINTGDHVQFAAVVVNAGNNDINDSEKIGVQYRVDNVTWNNGLITWNDNIRDLRGGQIKLFPVNGGGGQNLPDRNYWEATDGAHTVTAQADDSGRIAETNENNNDHTIRLTIPHAGITYHAEVDTPDILASTPTGIVDTVAGNSQTDTAWYTVQGIRLDNRPDTPGIYIHLGEKTAIH